MAIAITKNLTDISLCDVIGTWASTGGGTTAINADVFVQGVSCVHNYSAGSSVRGSRFDMGAGGTNLTNQNIYCWFSFSNKANIPVKGATGLRIRVTDTGGTNYSEWDIAGSDTLPHGGWIAYAIRTSVTPSRSSATPANLAAIRYVGFECGTTVGKTYIYTDAWRYGSGLSIRGGTSGTPATFESLYQYDSSNTYACGVIDKVFGVYYVQGQITIGDATIGDGTYFQDNSQVVVFKDTMVGDAFYDLKLQGNTTSGTEVYFGTLSNGRGITGCVFKCASSTQIPKYTVTASDTNITKYGFYGTTFLNANAITLQAYNVNKNFIDCSLQSCAEMSPNTGTVQYCNFISSVSGSAGPAAIKMTSLSHNISTCNFINCADGIEITTVASGYNFNALMFAGCNKDVKNTSGGVVVISPTNASNVTTYENSAGSTTTIQSAQITLTLTGLVADSEVRIYSHGTTTELGGVENCTSSFAYTYSYAASTYVDIVVHKADYQYYRINNYLLSASNTSLPIAQVFDRVYHT
jgi:hypothetical protein